MSLSSTEDLSRFSAWLDEAARFPLRPWLRTLILAAMAIVIAMATSLPYLPPVIAGVVALWTMIGLWVLALRVASRVLLATASGAGLEREYRDFDLPEFQALRQIGLWLVLALVLAALSHSFGPLALVAGLMLTVVFLPGMTCIVALDNALGSILKSERWRQLRMELSRASYRRLSLVLVGLGMVYVVLELVLGRLLPAALASGLMMGLWIYALWLWFYALGRALRPARSNSAMLRSPDKTLNPSRRWPIA